MDRHTTEPMILLERDDARAKLAHAFERARERGQLASISGEAGIGKSSLVDAFLASLGDTADILRGGCEALRTPRPLGALLDMAGDLGGATAERLAAARPRHEIFAAFIDDLSRRSRPVVAVFEDVHWADDATLDLLQYAGRRIARTRALVIVTWRDDEVGADHDLRRVLGEWPHGAVHRIQLQPLTPPAIERLAGAAGDAERLFALTGGNPFFVTEVLAGASGEVPASVRDAVLARRARLDNDARAVVDLVSVVPARAELELLREVAANGALDRCVTAGLLVADATSASFRHELARDAVLGALSPPRVQECHQRTLTWLRHHAGRPDLLARVVHHAVGAGAVDVVLEYAPRAARHAASLGAHRQAAAHYEQALQHESRLAPEAHAELVEALAYERYLTGDIRAAQAARETALEIRRRLGEPTAIGRDVRWLSRLAWFLGDGSEAERRAEEAIAVLSAGQPDAELAMAFSNRSQLHMLKGDVPACIEWGARAATLARSLGADEILSHALNNVGTARAVGGDRDALASVEESLALALRLDLHEHAARAYTNLGCCGVEARDYGYAQRWLDEGIAYTTERDLDSWTAYMRAWRARLFVETGRWQEGADDAEAVIGRPRVPAVSSIPAMAALGLVRARRGDPGAREVLDRALQLARPTGEGQRLGPVLAAIAELAWLNGRQDEAIAAAREGIETLGPGRPAHDRERFEFWLWRAGALPASALQGDGPYACLARGDWLGSSERWGALGRPYECSEALAYGDAFAVTKAIHMFVTLGAAPAADWARQRLRQLGVSRVPRGRRAATRKHPCGLTTREAEILALLAAHLKNPQIAERLFVSAKTVEHHVSSILAKLDVATREDAVARARREGWLTESPGAI